MTKKPKIPNITYSLVGWEDGKPYEKNNLEEPDRWEIQASDKVTVHFHEPSCIGDIKISQNPHSNQLGGYLWISGIMLALYIEYLMTVGVVSGSGNEIVVGNGVGDKKKKKMKLNTFLELGAGATGLPSIAMRRLEKKTVATDIPTLIKTLIKNIDKNCPVKQIGYPSALALEWEERNENSEFEQRIVDILEFYRVDDGLDAVMMADCIYSEASAMALVNTLDILCRKSMEMFRRVPVIFCLSEQRDEAAQEKFKSEAQKRNFTFRIVANSEWQTACLPESFRLDYFNLYLLSFASPQSQSHHHHHQHNHNHHKR